MNKFASEIIKNSVIFVHSKQSITPIVVQGLSHSFSDKTIAYSIIIETMTKHDNDIISAIEERYVNIATNSGTVNNFKALWTIQINQTNNIFPLVYDLNEKDVYDTTQYEKYFASLFQKAKGIGIRDFSNKHLIACPSDWSP